MMFTMRFLIYTIQKGLRNNFLVQEFPCYTIIPLCNFNILIYSWLIYFKDIIICILQRYSKFKLIYQVQPHLFSLDSQ